MALLRSKRPSRHFKVVYYLIFRNNANRFQRPIEYSIRWIKKEYNNPEVFITENGWSDRGELVDDDRIEYLHDHLKQIQEVVLNKECKLKGYAGKISMKYSVFTKF